MKATLRPLVLGAVLALSSPAGAVVVVSPDNFATAAAYSGSVQSVSSVGATAEPGEPSHNPTNPSGGPFHSIWWRYTPLFSGVYTIDTSGSNFDTVLAVYTGTVVSRLTRLAFNDDYNDATSRVRLYLTKGVSYHIAVDGFAGATGSANLHVALSRYFVARTYQGYVNSGEKLLDGGGMFTFTVANSGMMTGRFLLGVRSYPFTAAVDDTGTFAASAARPGLLPVSLGGTFTSNNFTLSDGVPAACTVGNVLCSGRVNGVPTNVNAYPAAPGDPALAAYFPATAPYTISSPCPRLGRYPFSTTLGGTVGYSVAAVTVGYTGVCTAAGRLGDGTAFAFTAPLLDNSGGGLQGIGSNGYFVFHVPLYASRGRLSGYGAFNAAVAPAALNGLGFWLRPEAPAGAVFLPHGLLTDIVLFGSRYTPPAPGTRLDAAFNPNGTLTFEASGSPYPNVTESVTLSPANTFTYAAPNANLVKLAVNVSTGFLTGSVKFNGAKAATPLSAVLIHNASIGTGFFGYSPSTAGYNPVTLHP